MSKKLTLEYCESVQTGKNIPDIKKIYTKQNTEKTENKNGRQNIINEVGVKNNDLVFRCGNIVGDDFFFYISYLSEPMKNITIHNLFRYDQIKKILNILFIHDLTNEILNYLLEPDYIYSPIENMIKYNRKLLKHDKIQKILSNLFCYERTKEILQFVADSDYNGK